MKSNTDQKITDERINQLKSFLIKLKITSKEFLDKNQTSNLQIIDEALTHTSAQAQYNHERLEFLGDAVLRLAASEFIDHKFPNMKVGERSALRSQLVSDSWLTKVGKSIQIEEILIVGPKAKKDSTALATLQAEATEALIGAVYECFQELHQIHNWLSPHWQESSIEVLNDPYRQNSKSALQEWSQSQGLKLPRYDTEELSKKHGDPKRFFCKIHIDKKIIGEGWAASRKLAEKEAANIALKNINNKKYRYLKEINHVAKIELPKA